jgi:uncharacterized membrane protein YhdT
VCTVSDDREENTYHSRGLFGFPRWLEVIYYFLNLIQVYRIRL